MSGNARVRSHGAIAPQGPGLATFTVTGLGDGGAGTLRDALANANAAPGADTLNFNAGLTGTITLTTGQIPITDDVTVTGPGVDKLTVSGGHVSRVFNVDDSTGAVKLVEISGLTINSGAAGLGSGGGIFNAEDLLLLLKSLSGLPGNRRVGATGHDPRRP